MLCNVENQFKTEQHAVVIKSHTCNLLSPQINQMFLTDVINFNLLCEEVHVYCVWLQIHFTLSQDINLTNHLLFMHHCLCLFG